jgi:DNA-binding beta-propeller fold protein YncE
MNAVKVFLRTFCCLMVVAFIASAAVAQTSSTTLLALSKSDKTVAIVDPATLQVLARVASGPDPHEIIASDDGTLAFISNYGGSDSTLNTISVVDLVARKALLPIDLGALRSTHGLAFAGGKLYFTAETNKVIGRYDPATQRVDWILGTGQDRTHMIAVSKSLDRIITSNVNSATISIIEQVSQPNGGFGPSSGGPGPPAGAPLQSPGGPRGWLRLTWKVTNIPAGRGVEGFDVSPDGKEIWAANARDGTVTIVDIATKKAVQTLPIPVKGANRLKFTPDGKLVLISALGARAGDSSLVVLDTSTYKEIKHLDLGGGSAGILIAPDGSRAFVAVSMADKIAVIDLKTLEVTGQIDAGKTARRIGLGGAEVTSPLRRGRHPARASTAGSSVPTNRRSAPRLPMP